MKNKKDLIARIAQNLSDPPAPAKPAPATAAVSPRPAKKASATAASVAVERPVVEHALDTPRPSTGSGKQAAFWLDDEDRAIFHETGMLLYSQGIKPSHNLVLRAAIRMIPRDHRLVEKVRELIEKDGRKVRHQKK